MAIEVRKFEGDAELLSTFVTRNWRAQYAQSGYAPNWTPAYFRRQLPDLAAGNTRSIISVYDGSTLVGVSPLELVPLTLKGRPALSVMSDWFTVERTRARSGIGRRLYEAQGHFKEEIGAVFAAGFINFGTLPGAGPDFWTKVTGGNCIALDKPRTWIRILNGRKLTGALWNRSDQIRTLAIAWADPLFESSAAPSVRDYRADDAAACHAIFTRHMLNFDLAYRWDQGRLAHHLGFGEPAHTLVLEKAGAITGFASFHIIDVFGRTMLRNGIIEVVAPKSLPISDQLDLIRSVVGFMRARDVDVINILGPPMHAATTLLATGFLPMPSTFKFMLFPTSPDFSLTGIKSVYTHFR